MNQLVVKDRSTSNKLHSFYNESAILKFNFSHTHYTREHGYKTNKPHALYNIRKDVFCKRVI